MDTSDPWITFDERGVCNHCNEFDRVLSKLWYRGEEGQRRLDQLADEIRRNGKGKEYDCVIGVSGGVDSSYLLQLAVRRMGLRPLAVHVDAGWNSELAVANIENLVKKLGIDLFTYVVDWEEMRDLQVAYLKSGLANQDVPQDHAFAAKTLEFAVKHDIKYVLNGSNIATESILPRAWGYDAMDSVQLLAIHRRFGQTPLASYPLASTLDLIVSYPMIHRIKRRLPLNCIDYCKQDAIKVLEQDFEWRDYGGKHWESRWTRFFQSYYLPKRLGFDKRRAHLSSLIVAGQMSREQALATLADPPFDSKWANAELQYVAKKLRISVAELNSYIDAPVVAPIAYRRDTLRLVLIYLQRLFRARMRDSFKGLEGNLHRP
jgi:N-acetyl sugar amidotransferase